MAPSSDAARLERLPPFAWFVIGIVALAIPCVALQTLRVRPHLFPAGSGVLVAGDPAAQFPLRARPPDIRKEFVHPPEITRVAAGSDAAKEGVVVGDRLVSTELAILDSYGIAPGYEDWREDKASPNAIAIWRTYYWTGVTGPVHWALLRSNNEPFAVTVDQPAAWDANTTGWARRHLGMIVQTLVFMAAAILLLVLKSHDRTAGLCVLAFVFSAVGGAGPLFGSEELFYFSTLGGIFTIFAWIASPLAFPSIAIAILYFPRRSPLIARHPWIQAVPLLAAAPLIGPALMTGAYLAGIDAARPLAEWDASHPGVYYAAFAFALGINVVAVAEGSYRYRINHNAGERRRIRMALYTAIPGVLAYVIRDGVPIVASLLGREAPEYSTAVMVILDTLVLLPAFGLVYAVGVANVLGPRLVLRRSLQYALASRSLTVLTVLPALALALSLVQERDRTLAQIATSSSALYAGLIVASVATFRYRERARLWLDQRFFREEYDARKILLSLASRVRFETDPADLATMVVNQLDEALHPLMSAILVSGIEDGRLAPVTVKHGSAESLPLEGGLVSMLRWSDEPLEIDLSDPRSPARRLPPEEREWLECTGAVLLVPVVGRDRTLIAVIALGERRSEEAYTAEDRQLLASIAAQMGLGFDVARLRRRGEPGDTDATRIVTAVIEPMRECPKCGRCEEHAVRTCPNDGTELRAVPSVPRTIDNKYRIEQLLGRGGMGAVYRARDMRLDRLVALKVVRAELLGDPEARRRFRREAQIVARLQHPSIVAVFDYGTFADGGAYLVMELVRGEDLRHVLQREGRLEIPEVMRILTSVCAAIGAAHREGVLHRDVKPENILLPGGGGPPKVLDFGVAKLVGDERPDRAEELGTEAHSVLTAAGMIIGTPAYMAPEQFKGLAADARTDIFSLAVVAYEMLSGQLPFGRGTLADVVLAQARGVPQLPPDLIPPPAERAIRQALDEDPDRRPASAQAFATLLGAALDA